MAELDCRRGSQADGTNIVNGESTMNYSLFLDGLVLKNAMEELSDKNRSRGQSPPEKKVVPQNSEAQLTTNLDTENDGNLNTTDGFLGTNGGISAALGSVAASQFWALRLQMTVPKPFVVPGASETEALASAPSDDNVWSKDLMDDRKTTTFKSKYINAFPLYQDYSLQSLKDGMRRFNQSHLRELVTCLTSDDMPILPSSCATVTSPPPLTPGLTPAPVTPPPVRVTSCTLWQDLEEVKSLGLLNTLNNKEIRLQEATFEMIGSEASYLRSLGVAVDHFYASTALRQTLSRMEHHVLFSNLRYVKAASERFLMDLEGRLAECVVLTQIGDIVLQHCPTFRSLYVPYVTNVMYQEALISQLLLQKKEFYWAVKNLEKDPVCQRQTLKSFLVLPFQRITRIKIIMESIVKSSKPDSESIPCLQGAIDAIHKIVTECDEGVQTMKRIEILVNLHKLVDFHNVKSIPLVTSRRFVVREGPFRQLAKDDFNLGSRRAKIPKVSFIEVYLHLFNDLLLISFKKEQSFSVLDHAVYPKHVYTEQLSTELLGLPSEAFLLTLSRNHIGQTKACVLAPYSSSEKDAWLKVLAR